MQGQEREKHKQLLLTERWKKKEPVPSTGKQIINIKREKRATSVKLRKTSYLNWARKHATIVKRGENQAIKIERGKTCNRCQVPDNL